MAWSDERCHGKKRPAEGDPDAAQPLAKRFGCLQIDHDRRLGASARTSRNESSQHPRRSSPAGDAMLLDDTEFTTYIHNLEQELVEPDPPADQLVLLPFAAKMISSVPESLVSTASKGKELVLYARPALDTASDEQNTVQRIIGEWRKRARANMLEKLSHNPIDNVSLFVPGEMDAADTTSPTLEMNDVDPMDIDY